MNLKDYIRGGRHGKEANRLERDAMDDPFLQGAIDGYDSVEGDHYSVIQELEQQLTKPRKRIDKRVWIGAVAALLLLLIGIPFLLRPPQRLSEPLVATTDTRIEKEIVTERTAEEETLKKGTLEEKTAEEETAPLEEIVITEATEEGKKVEKPQAKKTTKTTGIAETTKMAEEHKVLDMAQVVEAKTVETTEAEETAEPTRTTKAPDERTTEAVEVAQLKQHEVTMHKDKEEQLAEVQASAEGKQGHVRVSGRILDEQGWPLTGVTIFVENSKSGVVTDTDGKFSLSVPRDEKRPLIASFVGMHNETIPLKENVGDITMKEDAALLSEVVVVAFGKQKKESVVGSTAAAKESGKKKAEAKASGEKDTFGGKDTETKAFGKKEFKEYFITHYDKSLCQGDSIAFTVTFSIRSDGRPIGIQIQENSCPDLETEIKRLLLGSPLWTNTNRKVTLTVEIP